MINFFPLCIKEKTALARWTSHRPFQWVRGGCACTVVIKFQGCHNLPKAQCLQWTRNAVGNGCALLCAGQERTPTAQHYAIRLIATLKWISASNFMRLCQQFGTEQLPHHTTGFSLWFLLTWPWITSELIQSNRLYPWSLPLYIQICYAV